MEILLIIAYSSLFIFLICRLPFFRTSGISAPALSFLFVLKLFFGFSLWAIYTFYYPNRATADIYKYFDDSEVIFNALKTKPLDYFKMLLGIGNDTPAFDEYYSKMHYWARKNSLGSYNDGHTVIRFNAFIRLFSLGFYTVHTVFICFISFIGLTAIYKVFLPFLKNKKKGIPLKVLNGHNRSVLQLIEFPDKNLLASFGYDNSLKIWDYKRGKNVKSIMQTNFQRESTHSLIYHYYASFVYIQDQKKFLYYYFNDNIKVKDSKIIEYESL